VDLARGFRQCRQEEVACFTVCACGQKYWISASGDECD
jgi:hypothetical protein